MRFDQKFVENKKCNLTINLKNNNGKVAKITRLRAYIQKIYPDVRTQKDGVWLQVWILGFG